MYPHEPNRNIPKLLKQKTSSPLKSRGASEFYGLTDKEASMAVALKFVTQSGEQKAIHYHDIISPIEFDGSSKIVLYTSRLSITITGKHLEELFDFIIQHRVKWVVEPQDSFGDVGEGVVEIERINFDMVN